MSQTIIKRRKYKQGKTKYEACYLVAYQTLCVSTVASTSPVSDFKEKKLEFCERDYLLEGKKSAEGFQWLQTRITQHTGEK